jgi:hypothetical protein
MTYVKINGKLYPAEISGRKSDTAWDNRASKAITLEMDYETAAALFVDGLAWSIVQETPIQIQNEDENGNVTVETKMEVEEFDNSEYDIAGSITDNRNGTITAKMGKMTDSEMLAELLEVLNND